MAQQTTTRGRQAALLADGIVLLAADEQRAAALAELERMCDAAGVDHALLLAEAQRRAANRAVTATGR